ncbi:MAG: hypothetical protein QG602_3009 [Verrucomicrobiota bacterium]|nr:hypothetical protein [Verrucomicrobiota bacterium]
MWKQPAEPVRQSGLFHPCASVKSVSPTLLLFLLLFAVRAAAAEWQAMKPEDFAALPAVQERVDFGDFDTDLMAAAIFHATNRVRGQLGLAPFAHLPALDRAATQKATIGILQGKLTHENPLPLTATPADRVRASGVDYRAVAENIAQQSLLDLPPGVTEVGVRLRGGHNEFYRVDNKQPVQLQSYAAFADKVVRAWMNSPGHRANLVNPEFTSLGCAARPIRSPVARHEQVYAVQVFCTPR